MFNILPEIIIEYLHNLIFPPLQVNLCQKLLLLHQLTHNMTTDCPLNYKLIHENSKLKPGENMLCTETVSEQFLYTTCSPHFSQKEELSDKDLPVTVHLRP